jgi:hypothetical protein
VSELSEYTEAEVPSGRAEPKAGSLEARLSERVRQIEEQRTRTFPVPSLEDIIAVELRMMGWEAIRKIASRHERVRPAGLQEVYVAADHILAVTEGFHEIDEDGQHVPVSYSWVSLARVARPADQLPDDLTPRKALLAVVRDYPLITMWQEWLAWIKGEQPEVGEEVVRDFGMTR